MFNFYSLQHSIGATFDTEIQVENDSLWFVINDDTPILITLIHRDEQDSNPSLSISASLGTIAAYFPKDVLLELLNSHIYSAIIDGPRFSFMQQTSMLILYDKINLLDRIDDDNLIKSIRSVLDIAKRTKLSMTDMGCDLHLKMED